MPLAGNKLLPDPDELELTLIGPGYGESVVLHLGGGRWMIVDSCLGDWSGTPSALRYLTSLGVDPVAGVVLIVATHWHDDHIRGLANLVSSCPSADFVMSGALQTREFSRLVEAWRGSLMESSGLDEFGRILQEVCLRKQQIRYAGPDRCLYREANVEIHSLSPSDRAIEKAKVALSQLWPGAMDQKRRIASIRPNETSVALWIQAGEDCILLGADLEESGDPLAGWSAIVASVTRPTGKANLFKVPHHGSENGHHDSVWTQLLHPSPISALTPFSNGDVLLPTKQDVSRICSLSCAAYITAPPQRRSALKRLPKSVQKTLREMGKDVLEVPVATGLVRARKRPSAGAWAISLEGTAHQLPA
ncbi:MAG: MBL fold metallo-hydrolase [Candidatus Eremiobacterota bacterium]